MLVCLNWNSKTLTALIFVSRGVTSNLADSRWFAHSLNQKLTHPTGLQLPRLRLLHVLPLAETQTAQARASGKLHSQVPVWAGAGLNQVTATNHFRWAEQVSATYSTDFTHLPAHLPGSLYHHRGSSMFTGTEMSLMCIGSTDRHRERSLSSPSLAVRCWSFIFSVKILHKSMKTQIWEQPLNI